MKKKSLLIMAFLGIGLGLVKTQAHAEQMILYRAGVTVPASELMDLGDIGAIGGEILEGNPAASARFDYFVPGYSGGVFQVTRGTIRVTYPFTEHATILNGVVRIRDEHGNEDVLSAGDSYLITQGSTILVEVLTPKLQKSFYNYQGASDLPGPMAVFQRGRPVPDEDFLVLDPAALGGRIVEGDPVVSARFDLFQDSLVGGVFQTTQGTFEITMPFTEHGGIHQGVSVIQVGSESPQMLFPGDSYLILKGTSLRWEAQGASVQKTFLNSTLP